MLKFNLDFGLVGRPHGWIVNNVDASKCQLKIGGLKIVSYCSLVEKLVKKGVQQYLDKWAEFDAPKLVKKLEAKLKKKVGTEMAIELFEI